MHNTKQKRETCRFKFKINMVAIPTLSGNPVKALGKWYKPEHNNEQRFKDRNKSTTAGLAKGNRHQQSTSQMQSLDLSTWNSTHILWPLLVYDFPLTTVEMMESKVNRKVKQ